MPFDIRPLPSFEYAAPGTLAQAVALLEQHGGAARLLSGGTDLLPRMKKRKIAPRLVVDLNGISELDFIDAGEHGLRIGAGTRLATLYDAPAVREKAPALADALRVMSSPGIRNRATIGGNLCNASRCADTPAPLLVLDASVKLRGPAGERTLALPEFFVGPELGRGKTVIEPDEVMTEVIIPAQPGPSTFVKLGRRQGSSTSIISAAALAVIANGRFEEIRIAVSAFGATPIRSSRVEMSLRGQAVSVANIERAAALIKQEIDPISDLRASAAYRREMAPVVIKRALAKLAGEG
jgi:carbon-monoxide dehydrogenase medium subunit